jgi:glycosyltransferase involved in cell wall biosynthesis
LPLFTKLAALPEYDFHFVRDQHDGRNAATNTAQLEVIPLRSITFRTGLHGDFQKVAILLNLQPTLDSVGPDLVISGELGLRSWLAHRFCAHHSVPMILWVGHVGADERLLFWGQRWFRRYLCSRAAAICPYSEQAKQYLLWLGVRVDRIFVALNTCDTTLFQTAWLRRFYRQRSATPHIVTAGRLVPRKGVEHLLHAMVLVQETIPETRLSIAGSGPMQRQLQRLVSHLRLQHVSFLGQQEPSQLAQLFAEADLLVFPTLGDVWGHVVLEALASGLPVVGSIHSPAVQAQIRDGVNGYNVVPKDHHQLAAAILQLLTDRPHLEAMRSACVETAHRFGVEHCLNGIRDALRFAAGCGT